MKSFLEALKMAWFNNSLDSFSTIIMYAYIHAHTQTCNIYLIWNSVPISRYRDLVLRAHGPTFFQGEYMQYM